MRRHSVRGTRVTYVLAPTEERKNLAGQMLRDCGHLSSTSPASSAASRLCPELSMNLHYCIIARREELPGLRVLDVE
jgi:hypothetical protein